MGSFKLLQHYKLITFIETWVSQEIVYTSVVRREERGQSYVRRGSSNLADLQLTPRWDPRGSDLSELWEAIKSLELSDWIPVTLLGHQREQPVKLGLWTLFTTLPTTNWSERRLSSRTALSRSTLLLSDNGMKLITELLPAERRGPKISLKKRLRDPTTFRERSKAEKQTPRSDNCWMISSIQADSTLVSPLDPVNLADVTDIFWREENLSSTLRRSE